MNDTLMNLMAECLEISKEKLTQNTSIHNCDQWDSLRQMRIVLKLEEVFSIEIDEEEAMDLTSIQEIQDYLDDI